MDATVTASLPVQRTLPDVVIQLLGEPRGAGRVRHRIITPRAESPHARFDKDGRPVPFVHEHPDKETGRYQAMLKYAGSQAMRAAGFTVPLDCALRVRMTAVFSVPQSWSGKKQRDALAGLIRHTSRPDGDNLLKQLDGINKVVWRDDAAVVDWSIRKFYGRNPMMMIEIWRWTPPILL